MRRRLNNRNSKRRAQQHHARMRASQRFGIDFGPQDEAELVQQIQAGEARRVHKQSNRVAIFAVPGRDDMLVAYDRQRKSIVSFFEAEGFVPTDMAEE